jgi:hypothetical protein
MRVAWLSAAGMAFMDGCVRARGRRASKRARVACRSHARRCDRPAGFPRRVLPLAHDRPFPCGREFVSPLIGAGLAEVRSGRTWAPRGVVGCRTHAFRPHGSRLERNSRATVRSIHHVVAADSSARPAGGLRSRGEFAPSRPAGGRFLVSPMTIEGSSPGRGMADNLLSHNAQCKIGQATPRAI